MINSSRVIGGSLVSVAALIAGISGSAAIAAEPDGNQVPEIVVTAQKRSQNLQDVPISIAVVSADDMKKSRIQTVGDLQTAVPNFQLTENVGTKILNIRGVGGGGRNVGFDPRVGVYIDGVYISNPPALDSPLLDLDRVEVLRGPQGYLFGQNTDAGALSLITKAPSATSSARFVASYGNRNDYVLSAILNTPFVADKVLLKVAAERHGSSGFTRNLFTGDHVDGADDWSGRVQLRLLPTEDITVDLSLDYSRQKMDFVTGQARTDLFGGGPAAITQPFVIDNNTNEVDRNKNVGGSVKIVYAPSAESSLTSITAYRSANRRWLSDIDHSRLDISTFGATLDYQTFSQELRFTSSAFENRLKYVVGAYFQQDRNGSNSVVGFGKDIALYPFFGVTSTSYITSIPSVKTANYALFGSADYSITDQLTLNLGIRADITTKDLLLSQDGTTTSGLLFSPTFVGYGDHLREKNVTPAVGLTYKLTSGVNVYAKFARGAKNGGFNADFVNSVLPTPGGLRFKKETVDNYEGGIKSELFDRRLRINLAGFYAEYSNYQVSQFIQVNGLTSNVIGNAGKVETYGPEASVSFTPTAGLTFNLNGAYLHAKYLTFTNGGGIGINYDGNRTEYAPKYTFSGNVDFERPTGYRNIDFLAHLDYSYRATQYTQPSNAAKFRLGGYSLLGGTVGIGTADGRWQLSIYGKNLTNELYDANKSQDVFGTIVGKYGQPRTYGIELRVAI